MADPSDKPELGEEAAGRKSTLPSAREKAGGGPAAARPGSGRKPRRGKRGRGKHRDRGSKPTPARDLSTAPGATSPVQPDLIEADIEVDGKRWTVEVLGRTAGGGVRGRAPLLLLGFSSAASSSTAGAREALVVANALSGLSVEQLQRAFERSRPRRAAD